MCNRHVADPTVIQLDLIIEMSQTDTTYSYITNTGRRTRPATSDIFPPSERQNSTADWSTFPFFSKAFLSHKTKSHRTCMRSSTFSGYNSYQVRSNTPQPSSSCSINIQEVISMSSRWFLISLHFRLFFLRNEQVWAYWGLWGRVPWWS